MKGNLKLIGCGGAGINIAVDVYPKLKGISNVASNVSISLLDTTEKTIQAHMNYIDNFTKIISDRATVTQLDGTGGERKDAALAADIDKKVKEYVDTLKNNINDYYIVISSASGGSGSLISPLLTRAMLAKDFNVISVVIGDSSNLLSLNNTVNTISTLQIVAKQTKSALAVVYYNNTFNGVTTPKSEKSVNNKVSSFLELVSIFVSGDIQNLDHQDMNNFLRPTKYKSFTVAPGIYNLGVANGVLEDANTIMVRTIIQNSEADIRVNIPLLHNKTGIISEALSDMFNEYPVYMLYRKNILQAEVANLKEELAKLEELRKTEYDVFDSINTADEDDELGLVL